MSNGTGYTVGECTYGASLLESWIPPGLGDADQWISRAASKKLAISRTPVIGSAMVFSGAYPGSQGHGHVGIVAGIGAGGYPVIEEMNANRDGGGKGLYDTYQTTARDTAYLDGYLMPSKGQPSPVTASSLVGAGNTARINYVTGSSNGLPNLNPTDAATSVITGAFSGAVPFIVKAGEIVFGIVAMIVGLYFISKSAGVSVPGSGIIQKLPGVAGMATKMA